MSPKFASVITTLIIIPSLAVLSVTSESTTRNRTHREHVIWIRITLTEIGLVITELVSTLFISPSLTISGELKWFWKTSLWTHWKHVFFIIFATTVMGSKITILIRALLILKSLAISGISFKARTRVRTHGKHVIWVRVTLTKISLIITGLI
jgi:hypothetical protein